MIVRVLIISVQKYDRGYRLVYGIKMVECPNYNGLFVYNLDFEDIKLYKLYCKNLNKWLKVKLDYEVYDGFYVYYNNKKEEYIFKIVKNSFYEIGQLNSYNHLLIYRGMILKGIIKPFIEYHRRKKRKKRWRISIRRY